MMAEEGVLFKRLEKPVEFRKALLEASRDVIKSLQKYERFRANRIRKMEQVARLRTIVKEISLLVAKLKKDIPDVELSKAAPKKQKKKASKEEKEGKPKETKEEKPKAKKESKELADLEKDLKDIEGKLENLY